MKICSKCGYQRTKDDDIYPDSECPKCGVIYAKANQKYQSPNKTNNNSTNKSSSEKRYHNKNSFFEKWKNQIQEKYPNLYKRIRNLSTKRNITIITAMLIVGGGGIAVDGFFAVFIPLILLFLISYLIYKRFNIKPAKYFTLVTTNVIGSLLIIGGIIALLYSLSMDTSVSTYSGERIHNVGLMNQKQNFVIVSALILLIGVIVEIFMRFKADPNTSKATIFPETKQCFHCAEEIKIEALICRYCGKKQPQEKAKDKYTEKR